MLRYETLFLSIPEITSDEVKAIESQLDDTISKAKGNVISFERWGKYKLAYPVRKYDYGVYFLVRFEIDEKDKSVLDSLAHLLSVKQTDLIMRHLNIKLDPKQSLDYKRPESLEELPTRDVDTFLKENKMTGLMHKSSKSQVEDVESDDESDEENN